MSIDSKNGEHLIEVKVMENPAENYHLLAEGFIESRRTNPAWASVAEFQTEAGKQKLASVLKDMVQTTNCPILIAWDPQRQKVAGSLMMRGKDREIDKLPYKDQPGSYKYRFQQWEESTTKALDNLNLFYTPQSEELDIWNRFQGIDRVAIILSFGVLEEYARRGIGYRLVEKSLEVLGNLGYPLVYSVFTSLFSQKIAESCGFEEVISRKYAGEYLNELPEAMRNIHTHKCKLNVAIYRFPELTDEETGSFARQVMSQLTCKMCISSAVGIIFLPCAHLVCCVTCAPAMTQCPMCRRDIARTISAKI